MNALVRDLTYALRGLRRAPGFALLAVLTLALGIGANTAIFSVVHGAVLKPLPYPDPERLVYITSQFPRLGFQQFWISTPEFVELRDNNHAFVSVGAYSSGAVNLGLERPIRPVSAIVTDDLFPTLGVRPLHGRGFTRADMAPGAPDVAILSFELWQNAFGGDPSVVGQTVPVDGVSTQIVGILPSAVDVHDSKIEIWLPLTIDPAKLPSSRGSHFLYAVGRLKPDVSLAQARTDLERLLVRWPSNGGIRHVPDTKNHRLRYDPLKEDMVGGVRTAAWVLQAAVGFVLLIACANLASLILARAEARSRELAVRAALGAGRGLLLRQFMLEGLVLSLAGGAAGLLLARTGLDVLLRVNPGIPRTADISLDTTVLLFTLAVAVVTGVVFGLVPLFRLSDQDLHEMLKETAARTTASRGRARTRSALVVAEVALAVMLVVGAGLMLRTFWNLLDVDAGFDRSQMVTFRVVLPGSVYKPADRPAFFERLIARLRETPGVRSASAMSGLPPLRDVNANDTDFEDIAPTESMDDRNRGPIENVDYYQGVTVDYTATMGIPVVEGRSFERTDIEGAPVVMVNETLARTFFPGRSAVGRRLKPGFGDKVPWFTIVGVVKDVKQKGVDAKTGTELYLLTDQLPRTVQFGVAEMNVVVRTSLPVPALASIIQGTVQSMDRSLPVVGLRTMDDVFTETVSRPRFLALLLAIFAAIALSLAAVGSYGVLSWLVAERRPEIGVRMALGAGRGSVLALILRQGLALTGLGIAIGLLSALVLTRLVASLLFGVQPTDPATLLAGVGFMAIVGLAACMVPALRATRVDPIVVLKSE